MIPSGRSFLPDAGCLPVPPRGPSKRREGAQSHPRDPRDPRAQQEGRRAAKRRSVQGPPSRNEGQLNTCSGWPQFTARVSPSALVSGRLACCFKLNRIWVCLIQRPNDGSPPVTRGTVFGRTGPRTVGLSSGWPIPEIWGLDSTSTAPNRPEALLRSRAPVISIRDVTTLPMQRCAGLHSVRTMVVIYLPNNRTRAWPNLSV